MTTHINKLLLNNAFYAYILLFLLIFSPFILNNTGINLNFIKIQNPSESVQFRLPAPTNLEFTAIREQSPRLEGLRNQRSNFTLQHTFYHAHKALFYVINKHITPFIHQIAELQFDSHGSHTAIYLVLDLPPPAGSTVC